jgi:hypothetical protein
LLRRLKIVWPASRIPIPRLSNSKSGDIQYFR